jgi:hypothetical protein
MGNFITGWTWPGIMWCNENWHFHAMFFKFAPAKFQIRLYNRKKDKLVFQKTWW